MNLPTPVTQESLQRMPMMQNMQDDEEGFNLLEALDLVMDQRWLIAAVVALVTVLGLAYAYTATPIYQADALVQVEDNKVSGPLGDGSGLFDIRSPASAEMEILRSRLVVGQAVASLNLDLVVNPKYVPLIGRWLSRRASAPSTPGFLGMSGYVTGNEFLKVARFQVSPQMEGVRFSVRAADDGFEVQSPDGAMLGKGKPGEPMVFEFNGGHAELLVADIHAKPGAEFYVTKLSRLSITQSYQNQLQIAEQGRSSGVIKISLQGANPAATATVLNEISAFFVRQNVERRAAEAEKSIAFLNTQLPDLRAQLENSENKFTDYRNRNGTFALDQEASTLLQQAVDLHTKLMELEQKRRELETRFTPAHPSVKTVTDEIAHLKAQIADLEHRVKTLPNTQQDLLRLTRDVSVNNNLYTSLLNSFQQLSLVKEGKVGNVRVIDVAAVPEVPVKPQRMQIVSVALLLGVLAGLGLAYLRNSLRPGIRHADDIEQRLGLHVFATVPHSAAQAKLTQGAELRKGGQHLLANLHPDEATIESLRSLRTALQFAMLDAANNVVAISGATPGVGKSFISANFAAVLAAGGKRVLLVDADMRKGHMHGAFGFERGHGLSELIAGTQTVEQVVHKAVSANLDFIGTGLLPPNPAELLMSGAMAALVSKLSAAYDIVVIDTPPILAVSDTQVIAPLAGTLFLLARADTTTLAELQESEKRLARSGVAVGGVIFNDLDISRRRYGYGYGYKYGRYRYASYEYAQGSPK